MRRFLGPLSPTLSPMRNDRNVWRDGKPTEVVSHGGEGARVGKADLCGILSQGGRVSALSLDCGDTNARREGVLLLRWGGGDGADACRGTVRLPLRGLRSTAPPWHPAGSPKRGSRSGSRRGPGRDNRRPR